MVTKLTELFVEACRLRCEAGNKELVEVLDEIMMLAGGAVTLGMQAVIEGVRNPAPPVNEDEEIEGGDLL